MLILTGQAPVAGALARWIIQVRKTREEREDTTMKLIVDLQKDFELIKTRFEHLIPEESADVAALVRHVADDAQGKGISAADVLTGVRMAVADLEALARDATAPA